MGRILSQGEIDALLHSGAEIAKDNLVIEPLDRNLVRYNFRRPDRVSKDQIHALSFLHNRFARNVATSLSAYLRTITDLSVTAVEQFSYSEFLMSLSDPTAFYALAIPPFDELGALEINPAIAFAMVDRMLGGSGQSAAPDRALTEIEQNVVDSIVKILLEALAETWRPLVTLAFGIRGRETRPQMLQVAAPNEIVIMVVFDVRIGDVRGMMNLCIPASIAETMGAQFVQAWQPHHRDPTETERSWLQQNLATVELDVSAVLESKLLTSDLLALSAGDVIGLGVASDRPIDVRVGGTLKFKGRLGVSGRGRLGVRIERRCDSNLPEEEA
jgi:flagellar motor switch protein FliM